MHLKNLAFILALAIAPALAHADDPFLNSSCTTAIGGTSNGGSLSSSLSMGLLDPVSNQTMQFSGSASAEADYSQLHGSSTASITNNVTDFNTTGATGFSSSLAEFDDTLIFAGIPSGYHAQYYFLIQGSLQHTGNQTGTDSGTNATIDFSVGDDYDQDKTYDIGTQVAGSNGVNVNDLWKPLVVDLDGALTEEVDVTFQTEAVVSTTQNVDGNSFSYSAAFQDTLALSSIDVVDDNGVSLNPSLWSVSSESGTVYAQGITAAPVPEPATIGVVSFAVLALVNRRRARQR